MDQHQKYLLSLLKEIDQICKKHDITYCCAGGTVIGAARHRGFIPWDDDIDIYMTRSEFYRFAKAMEEEAPEGRVLEYYENDHGFRSVIPRYCAEKTTMFNHFHLFGYPCAGAMIDVFILDPVPDDLKERHSYLAKLYAYADFLMPVMTFSHRVPEEYFQIYQDYRRLAEEIGTDAVIDKIASEIFSYDKKDCQAYCLRWGSLPAILPAEIMDEPVYLPFEDMNIPVPGRWYDYLCLLFDSRWMDLPYVDKRHVHNSILHYDRSYEEYYRKRDDMFSQEELLRIHTRWKDSVLRMTALERPIEKYAIETKSRICQLQITNNLKKAGAQSIEELYEQGNLDMILACCRPYLILQTDHTFAGKKERHGSQYHWFFPVLIPLKDEEIIVVLKTLLEKKQSVLAEKLLGIFKRAGHWNDELEILDMQLNRNNRIRYLYYEGRYDECIREIEASKGDRKRLYQNGFWWLAKVRDGIGEEAAILEQMASEDDAGEEFIKAWGDHLWNSGKKSEAESVYHRLMAGCRNGLFWMEIKEKGVPVQEIPLEQPSSFVETDCVQRQRQLLEEIASLCEDSHIHYTLGPELSYRMFKTGNLGYDRQNREVFMDAENAERFMEAFAKKGSWNRRLLSWREDDSVKEFSLLYMDTCSFCCDYLHQDHWRGKGIFVIIRILRRDKTPAGYRRGTRIGEFLLNMASLDAEEYWRLNSRKKKALYHLLRIINGKKNQKRIAERIFKKSINTEKQCGDGRYYYYLNTPGRRPKRVAFEREWIEETIGYEMNDVIYSIPRAVSSDFWPETTDPGNQPPRTRVFFSEECDITWEETAPLIDENAYGRLPLNDYAAESKKYRSLNRKVHHIWQKMLDEGQKNSE